MLDSRKLPGKVIAGPATGVHPQDYDLVGLCMMEPQYRAPGVRESLDAVAKSRVPCMSIMNMPPLRKNSSQCTSGGWRAASSPASGFQLQRFSPP